MSKKNDQDKLPYHLLPFDSIDKIVEVQKFGIAKYGANTWQKVPNGKKRYIAAALRHISKFNQGERFDSESNLNHLAHATCSLIYALHIDNKYLRRHKIKAV